MYDDAGSDPSYMHSDVTYDHAAAHANLFKHVDSAFVGKFRLVFVPLLFSITLYSLTLLFSLTFLFYL